MNLRNSLSVVIILTALFSGVEVQAQVIPGEEHCVVNVRSDDSLNVRSGAGARFEIVVRLRANVCGITVVGQCREQWCPVEDGHFRGWVNKRFISIVSPAMYCVSDVGPDDTLKLRAFPSASSRVVRQLAFHQCDIAFLPYAKGTWQKVRVEGYEGWVNRRYLSGQ